MARDPANIHVLVVGSLGVEDGSSEPIVGVLRLSYRVSVAASESEAMGLLRTGSPAHGAVDLVLIEHAPPASDAVKFVAAVQRSSRAPVVGACPRARAAPLGTGAGVRGAGRWRGSVSKAPLSAPPRGLPPEREDGRERRASRRRGRLPGQTAAAERAGHPVGPRLATGACQRCEAPSSRAAPAPLARPLPRLPIGLAANSPAAG